MRNEDPLHTMLWVSLPLWPDALCGHTMRLDGNACGMSGLIFWSCPGFDALPASAGKQHCCCCYHNLTITRFVHCTVIIITLMIINLLLATIMTIITTVN